MYVKGSRYDYQSQVARVSQDTDQVHGFQNAPPGAGSAINQYDWPNPVRRPFRVDGSLDPGVGAFGPTGAPPEQIAKDWQLPVRLLPRQYEAGVNAFAPAAAAAAPSIALDWPNPTRLLPRQYEVGANAFAPTQPPLINFDWPNPTLPKSKHAYDPGRGAFGPGGYGPSAPINQYDWPNPTRRAFRVDASLDPGANAFSPAAQQPIVGGGWAWWVGGAWINPT